MSQQNETRDISFRTNAYTDTRRSRSPLETEDTYTPWFDWPGDTVDAQEQDRTTTIGRVNHGQAKVDGSTGRSRNHEARSSKTQKRRAHSNILSDIKDVYAVRRSSIHTQNPSILSHIDSVGNVGDCRSHPSSCDGHSSTATVRRYHLEAQELHRH